MKTRKVDFSIKDLIYSRCVFRYAGKEKLNSDMPKVNLTFIFIDGVKGCCTSVNSPNSSNKET